MAEKNTDNTIVIPEKKQSGISKALDKKFHFTERGSSMGSEIGAGFGAFCISICALLVNTRIIGEAYGNYAGSYLAVTLLAFAGSLLLGLLCNFPLVQTANMGLSSILISMLGVNEGLTYANLMFVTFIAAILYLVVVVTPAKKFFTENIPDGVKKALPVGLGLYVAATAIKNTGIVDAEGGITAPSTLPTLDQDYFWLLLAGTVLFLVLKAFHRTKPMTATFWSLIGLMWVGGIVFFLDYFIGGQTAATVVYHRVNMVVATDGASPYNIAGAIASLHIGQLFRSGLDFSAYTAAGGSVFVLMVKGVLSFLFLGLYNNLGYTQAAAVAGDYEDEEYATAGKKKVHIIGAALNVIAPVLGVPSTSVGAESGVAVNDGGKTGLVSVTAAIGFFISLFSWVFLMLMATGTHGVGMWIDDTEIKLAAYVQDTFIFADLIMAFVGASMLKGIRNVDTKKLTEFLPFAITVVVTAFMGNVALGVALGYVAYVLCMVCSKDRKDLKGAQIGIGVLMLIFAIAALI